MAKKETKFNKLLNSDETMRSSDAHKISAPIKREAKKEFDRREKEREAKRRKFGIRSDVKVPPISRSIPDATKAKAKKVKRAEKEKIENTASRVDLDEMKKAQEELRKEQGYQEPEIDYSYKKSANEGDTESLETAEAEPTLYNPTANVSPEIYPTAQEDKTPQAVQKAESNEAKEQNPQAVVNVSISIPEGMSSSEITISKDPAVQSIEDEGSSDASMSSSGEPLTQKEEEYVREEYQIPEEYKDNEHVSKISNDEIEEVKRQLAIERGELPPDEEAVEGSKEDKEKADKQEIDLEDKEKIDEKETALETEEPQEEAKEEDEPQETENKALDAIKKASKKHGEKFSAPEESLPDNITDQEIEDVMQQQEEEEASIEEEEEEDYSGMTDEEVAEAKERRRKLKELQARYNRKEAVQEGDEGDYRKSLDFTINTSIKRFRVKPPKKPIIITISAVFLFLIVAGIVTYFILNRPPAPVVMSSISLSQEETFQDVGEELDLRGLYIDCKYSDGSIKSVPVTESMISRKSENIDADNMIASYDKDTYVYFTVNGYETMLEVTLTQIIIEENSLSVEIIGESFSEASIISFDNILVLARTTEGRTLRFDASEAVYKIGDTILPKIETDFQSGLQLPVGHTGEVTISVSVIHNDNVYSTEITLSITALN